MPAKVLCIIGMVASALIFLLFALDLIPYSIVPIAPFKNASYFMDIVFLICAAGLGYISWSTYREQQ